ncbi:MAG: hypothetical protein ACTHLN_01420 [Tepidisphaeraceae bacterium]
MKLGSYPESFRDKVRIYGTWLDRAGCSAEEEIRPKILLSAFALADEKAAADALDQDLLNAPRYPDR